ncbi:MAG TPA: Ku protein [Clostridia bacterium]|nr:Ku protein [Clostridia bacterium]
MPAAYKAAISFGLVYIPVELHTATQDSGIAFNQLHRECKQRIRYKKTCPPCNIEEVKPEDIVKGYEYEPGKYVIMYDEDFEKIKTPKDKAITILHFANLDEIDSIYYEKTYYVVPDGSDKAYALLKTAMQTEKKIAVAKTVLGTKERMVAIRPASDTLIIETMYFLEEIKSVPVPFSGIDLNPAELDMAKLLINNMTDRFRPELYKDEYTEKLRRAIEQKIRGEEIVEAKPQRPDNVIDLMEALRQSVQNTKKA